MENYVILHARNPYDMSVLEVRMKGHLNLHTNILNIYFYVASAFWEITRWRNDLGREVEFQIEFL